MPAPHYRRIAPATLLAALCLFCAQATAQTLTIRMINARSGKPIDGKSVNVEFQGVPGKAVLAVDKHGIGHLTIPPGATAISFIAASKKGSVQNIPAYTVCGPFGEYISIQDILAHGFVPQNACGSTPQLTAAPGELLYLIEPLPWYTPALQ
jgi:hypothetical protein